MRCTSAHLHLQLRTCSVAQASAVLPADTSESLVFASSELARLRRRISELAQEKSEARQVRGAVEQKMLREAHPVLDRR